MHLLIDLLAYVLFKIRRNGFRRIGQTPQRYVKRVGLCCGISLVIIYAFLPSKLLRLHTNKVAIRPAAKTSVNHQDVISISLVCNFTFANR